jgi:hypothetical protein
MQAAIGLLYLHVRCTRMAERSTSELGVVS